MKRSLMIAAAALTATAAQAGPQDKFDLACTGKQFRETGKPAVRWQERLRFDLEAKRWCRGACRLAGDVSSVTADEILIYDSHALTDGPGNAVLSISRTNGGLRETVLVGSAGYPLVEGRCVREPFSGLPGQRF